MSKSRQFCTFSVGEYLFGVDVARVQEVVRYQAMTRVPLAPREISGLINLRGQIITAIDLRLRLRLPARAADARPTNVLIATDEGAVSFLVDQIEDVIEVEEAVIEPPPAALDADVRGCIAGVCKLRDRLLLILDETRAMEFAA